MGNKQSRPELDLTGKVAIVTGGNTGIGYETAKGLARLGAHTFIACRSKERAEEAIERMKTELGTKPKEEPKEKDKETAKKEAPSEEEKPTEVAAPEGEPPAAAATTETPSQEETTSPEGVATETPSQEEKTTEPPSKEEEKGEEESPSKEEPSSQEEQEAATGGGEEQTGGEGGDDQVDAEGEEVKSKEEKEVKVEFLPLDLSSLQSTTDFVRAFKEKDLPLHILINNAAVAWTPFKLTDDGYEVQFQVNHLGPMLLTLELLPLLTQTAATSGDGRIIFVTSKQSFKAAAFDVEKLVVKEEANHERLTCYANTKLYNVMTAYALQRRLGDTGVTVSCPEPGYVKTGLAKGFEDKPVLSFLNKIGYAIIARSPAEGAETVLNCAVNPDLNKEQCHFYSDCKVAQPSNQALNEKFQEQLWGKTIEILKDRLSPEVLAEYGEAHVPETPPPEETAPAEDTPPEETAPTDVPTAEDTPTDKPAEDTPTDQKDTPPEDTPTDQKDTPPADTPTDQQPNEADDDDKKD